MGSIIGWLVGKTVLGNPITEPIARAIAYAALALLLVGGLWGAKCAYDNGVINRYRAAQTAATATADKQADDHAATARRTDDSRTANETQELQRSTTDAQTNLARNLAFQHCLRSQQAARAAKRQPPACG